MQEMLLREDNYNNHFANGGVGKHQLAVNRATSSAAEVAEWMLKKRPSLNNVSPAAKAAAPGQGGRGRRETGGAA